MIDKPSGCLAQVKLWWEETKCFKSKIGVGEKRLSEWVALWERTTRGRLLRKALEYRSKMNAGAVDGWTRLERLFFHPHPLWTLVERCCPTFTRKTVFPHGFVVVLCCQEDHVVVNDATPPPTCKSAIYHHAKRACLPVAFRTCPGIMSPL